MRSKKSCFYLLFLTLFLTFNLISCGGGGGGGSAAPAGDPLIVFVTSASGTGNLGSWQDAIDAGQTAGGLAAGDAICQAAADDAGLPGTYRAWLSTDTTDAYCHIQGYTGTYDSNCGQTTRPTAAGPWVRTGDDHPFARLINFLIDDRQVYVPVRYDEDGTLLVNVHYFTGTSLDGRNVSSQNCQNWTNSSYGVAFGTTEGTSSWWTYQGGGSCSDTSYRLLCFQTGTGGPLPSLTVPAGAKRVFVTSTTYNGNLGGLAGADSLCQERASAGGLANAANYKAWLSTTTSDVEAIDHITSRDTAFIGPWYRLDNVKVADTKADLTDGRIFTAISRTETGSYINSQYYYVWTGTGDNGVGLANNCNDWTDNTSTYSGHYGFAGSADANWTAWSARTCNQNAALYCFED